MKRDSWVDLKNAFSKLFFAVISRITLYIIHKYINFIKGLWKSWVCFIESLKK